MCLEYMVAVTWLSMNQQIILRRLMLSSMVVPSPVSNRYMAVVMLLLLLLLRSESMLHTKSMRHSVVVMVRMLMSWMVSGMRTQVPTLDTMRHTIMIPHLEELQKLTHIQLLKMMVQVTMRMQELQKNVVKTILTERVLPIWKSPVDVSM